MVSCWLETQKGRRELHRADVCGERLPGKATDVDAWHVEQVSRRVSRQKRNWLAQPRTNTTRLVYALHYWVWVRGVTVEEGQKTAMAENVNSISIFA